MTAEARRPGGPDDDRPADHRESLDVEPLTPNNASALPEVYEVVHGGRTMTVAEIRARTGRDRQVVHGNLDRLVRAGLVEGSASTFRLVEPALAPSVVRSVAELGSPLRWDLRAFALDEGELVVEDARRALDLSAANTRTVLNALADDGYLSKRSGAREGGRIGYRVTEAGERELGEIDDPDEYLDRGGETVEHYVNGIEGTAFRPPYGIEDVALVARRGPLTVAGLLAETDRAEKSTRRRLSRLAERGLLEETRRRAHNEYRPTPRTRRMVAAVRDGEDERLPEPFLPADVFRVSASLLHDASPDLADRYVSEWKSAGFVEGSRHERFRFVHGE